MNDCNHPLKGYFSFIVLLYRNRWIRLNLLTRWKIKYLIFSDAFVFIIDRIDNQAILFETSDIKVRI